MQNMRKAKIPIEINFNFMCLLLFGSVVLDIYVVSAANYIFKLKQKIYERKKKTII